MMRSPALLLLCLMVGCAPSVPDVGSAPGGPATISVGGDASAVEYERWQNSEVLRPVVQEIEAPPARAWSALLSVQQELGIDPETVEPSRMIAGNRKLVISNGRLAGQHLSTFVECGAAEYGGRAADRYRVALSVLTQLRAGEGNRTVVSTLVQGTASNHLSGQSRAPVACASTGALERRIADALLARVDGEGR